MKLNKVFGRINWDTASPDGTPFIVKPKGGTQDITPVLAALEDGKPTSKIIETFRISPDDLSAIRAFHVRFGTNPDHPHSTPPRPSVLMDENMSFRALPAVSRSLGWSSHVAAEGLVGNKTHDEKEVWGHAAQFNFAAVMTADSDFLGIARRRHQKPQGHEPSLIYVDNNYAPDVLGDLVKEHCADIREFIEQGREAPKIATLSLDHGFEPYRSRALALHS